VGFPSAVATASTLSHRPANFHEICLPIPESHSPAKSVANHVNRIVVKHRYFASTSKRCHSKMDKVMVSHITLTGTRFLVLEARLILDEG
jgi:hypothetical protein